MVRGIFLCVGMSTHTHTLHYTTNRLFKRARQAEPSLVHWDMFFHYNEGTRGTYTLHRPVLFVTDWSVLSGEFLNYRLCVPGLVWFVGPISYRRWRKRASALSERCNRHTSVQYISAAILFSVASLFVQTWRRYISCTGHVEPSMVGKRLNDERVPQQGRTGDGYL
jgi:AraC-like DNA-binding protein